MIDLTVGAAGHAEAILARLRKDARLIGFDRDIDAVNIARTRLQVYNQQVTLVHDSYANFDLHLPPTAKGTVDFALLDLGLSSLQLERSGRGFAHQALADPLDLRFDASTGIPAHQRLRQTDSHELSRILAGYGEIAQPRRVAAAISQAAKAGRLLTVADLVAAVQPLARREKTKQFLSQIWQALRIWINDELAQLDTVLPKIVDYLRPQGVLAVISFHSLEDRAVKQFFATQEHPCVCPPALPVCACGRQPTLQRITRKAVKPGAAEIHSNPRSRSARLRAAMKLVTS